MITLSTDDTGVSPLHHPHRDHRHQDDDADSGFTLVELLVVMVVIGVLASIAVPVFLHQRQKAQETAVRADLRTIAAAVHAHGVEAGRYPTASELNAAGVALRTSSTVVASVVWRTSTDFCLAGTSTAGGPDPTGVGSPLGVRTRVFVVSAKRPATAVTTSDYGCLGSVPPPEVLSPDNGYWAEDGFHPERIRVTR